MHMVCTDSTPVTFSQANLEPPLISERPLSRINFHFKNDANQPKVHLTTFIQREKLG